MFKAGDKVLVYRSLRIDESRQRCNERGRAEGLYSLYYVGDIGEVHSEEGHNSVKVKIGRHVLSVDLDELTYDTKLARYLLGIEDV